MKLRKIRFQILTFLICVGILGTGCSTAFHAVNKTAEEKQISEIHHNTIADCGIILDQPDEIVIVTLYNGNMFAFQNEDVGEWEIGDIVTLLFDDNGTEIIYDDIIIDYRYSGHINSPEVLNYWAH